MTSPAELRRQTFDFWMNRGVSSGQRARTALSHGGLPVVEALGDELVDARLAPDAANLLRRADARARAACHPSCPTYIFIYF